MRQFLPLLAVLICSVLPASAQVTIDLHALDALPGAKAPAPHTPPPAPHPTPRRAPRPHASAKPTKPAQPPGQATATAGSAQPATAPASSTQTQQAAPQAPGTLPKTPPGASPPPATLPAAPPPAVALAPIAPPQPEAQPPAAPPVSATATTAATSTGNGLRLTFAADQADLNPASAAAIDTIVQNAQASANSSFNVVAYAAGSPDDPSTARRLSLARALAVRSALIADGVASSRIYVRALGSQTSDGPPDRVDVTLLGGNEPPANSPGQAPADSPGKAEASTPGQTGAQPSKQP